MSGQAIGTLAGYFIGGWFGSPQLGALIGGTIGGYLDPQVIKASSIGDAQQQTSQAGMPIPKVYGHSPPIAPTLIDGDKIARKIIRKEKQGKGAPTIVESEAFIATRAFLVCEGEIAGFARITRNGKLVYSTQEGDELDADSAAFASHMTIYLGTQTQGPDPSLEALHGVGNTNYYRGRAYFVVRDDDETQSGGAMNQYRVEVLGGTGTTSPCSTEVAFVAVGASGLIATSHDGKAYEEKVSGVSTFLNAVARNKGSLVVVGEDAVMLRSTDNGDTWAPVDPGITASYMPAIAASRNALIAVANDGGVSDGQVTRSFDGGLTWFPVDAPIGCGPLVSVTYGDARFIIISNNGNALISTNEGSSWDVVAVATGLIAITYGSAEFVTVGDGGRTYTSTDGGQTWTFRSEPGPGSFSFLSVAILDGLAIAGANGSALVAGLYSSPDNGVTWTRQNAQHEVTNGVCAAGGLYLAGQAVSSVSWSEDGANYTIGTGFTDSFAVSGFAYIGADPSLMPVPDAPGTFYDPWQDRILVLGNCVDKIAGDAAIWRDVVTDIANRASTLLPDQLDINNMTDAVPGYVLGNATLTGTDYVRTLCTFYFTDLPEYDDELHAIRRGGAIVATLDPDDLLAIEDEDDDDREAALKAFRRVTITYPDPANKYIATPQTAPRTSPDVSANSNVTIECPIPFSADLATQKADIMQRIAFLQVEGTFKRAFTAEYSRYVASDPVIFNDRRHIITKTSNDESMVRFEGTYDRPSAYTSLAIGSNAPTPEPQTSNLKGPTLAVPMNLPQLRAADNVPGMYVALQGMLPGWPGADLYLSVDGGLTEQLVGRVTFPSTIGFMAQDCDDGINSPSTDDMVVQLYPGGEVETITADQIAARQNAFAVLSSGLAEVGQFQTADEDISVDRLYTLTDLTRGELGTDAAEHFIGDRWVLLDGTILFVPIDPAHAGETLIFRAVTLGTAAANNPTVSVVYDPGEGVEDGGTPA